MQEANKTFSQINEALCKLETKSKSEAAGLDEESFQLLRKDLSIQGETLSSAVLDLCSDVRSSTLQPEASQFQLIKSLCMLLYDRGIWYHQDSAC